MSQNNNNILYVGLDVAKLSLQLHLAGRFHSLSNDARGHDKLLKLLRGHSSAHVVCEANKGSEHKLGDWGFDVIDAVAPAAKAKPAPAA